MRPIYRAVTDVIETDLENEFILLDPQTQEMFVLNETGRRIWRALPAREEMLVRSVLEAYDVPRESAEADVRRLMAELLEARLVETSTGEMGVDGAGEDGFGG
jgi:hypothetical protein